MNSMTPRVLTTGRYCARESGGPQSENRPLVGYRAGARKFASPLSTGLHVAVAQPHLFMYSNVKTQDLCIVCFIAWTRNEDLAHAKEQATHLGFMHMHRDEFGSDTHEYEFSVTIYHILIQIQIQIQILSNTNTKQIFRICNWLLTRFIA
jgi:hypothetical protein